MQRLAALCFCNMLHRYDPPAEAQFLTAQELQAVKKVREMTVLPVIVRVRDLVDLLKVSSNLKPSTY